MSHTRIAIQDIRVLIADQQASTRAWLREQLSTIGVSSISQAVNANDVLRQVRNNHYDAVLCDHHLDAKKDGQQLLAELRHDKVLPLHSAFLIVTAERLHDEVVAAAEFAPDDYLLKPYAPRELLARISRALDKKNTLRPIYDAIASDNTEETLAQCDMALGKSKRYALDIQRLKAEALIASGRSNEALSLYESVLGVRVVPWARMGYALALCRQKRFEEAEDAATTLNVEHPEYLSVYDLLAHLREQQDDLPGAVEHLNRAVRITEGNPDRLRTLADLAERANDMPTAIQVRKRLLQRTENTSMARVEDHLSLMRNLLEEDDTAGAEQIGEQLKQTAAQSPNGASGQHAAESTLLAHRGQAAEAAEAALRAVEKLDGAATPGLTSELAITCQSAGLEEEASRLAQQLADSSDAAAVDALKKLRAVQGKATAPAVPYALPEGGEEAPTEFFDLEAIMGRIHEALTSLAETWREDVAEHCRELMTDAFTAAPRDRRVVESFITYNNAATEAGKPRHQPRARKVPA